MSTHQYGPHEVEVPDFSPNDIKSLRKKLGLSAPKFALKFELPLDSLRAWESGRRRPSAVRRLALQKIAELAETKVGSSNSPTFSEAMTVAGLQDSVEEWVSQPQHKVKYFPPFEIVSQMVEELGEIAREVSHLHGFKKKKDGEQTDGLEIEIGDLLFALTCLANSHEIDLAAAFRKSLDKKYGRDQQRFAK